MPSDTSEKGLESIIENDLCERGWIAGAAGDYHKGVAIDLKQFRDFMSDTQPAFVEILDLDNDSPVRLKAISRIQGEITSRGIIDVLRNGIKHGPNEIVLFYGTPSKGNEKSKQLFAANRFTVVRQLHFSPDETKLSLDMCLFINGLPVITFELKNSLTKQTVADAIVQYQTDRDPKELIFQFKRTIGHFAVDDLEVWFCTKLEGKASWFLPFNRGNHDGAGNPHNPDGLKTAYLWQDILTPQGLTDLIENYAQVVVEEENSKTRKKTYRQVFPRFHQLSVVRKLLEDARTEGVGRRYLIEHSAGSGKSNSIAWLAHQLIRLEQAQSEGATQKLLFDSVIVITDRRVLDKQIRETIKQFAQVSATVGHARTAEELRKLIQSGKKIIITTIQKFPLLLDTVATESKDRRFAIVIDEAHSSQGGRTAAALVKVLANSNADDDGSGTEDDDEVQDLVNQAMAARKMLENASYFAFTATPKNRTLEMFGEAFSSDGKTKHRPFHTYSMKQAIQEGFILDVLKSYTPVQSYYKLVKAVEDDPSFDVKRANKKLRAYVEGNNHAIAVKAGIMIDHFVSQVITYNKIGGRARAMVVTGSIKRAVQYFSAVSAMLQEQGGQYKAIVAFSGEHEFGGKKVTEASLNGFSSNEIPEKIQEDPYRFLICADKFQTGYDEPLLHTMYVDKVLSGIKAVQTLSRLNRAHPKKHDVFVLDFQNDTETIRQAFADFYRTTVLSDETDANKLHDVKAKLDSGEVYEQGQVDAFVGLFLSGADREQLDPILDACVETYKESLGEDGQVSFKGSAKGFVRTYDFLACVLPYNNAGWEKLSIFLTYLIPKLPAPMDEDLSKGVLEAIDMESYRAEKQAVAKIVLPDEDAEIDPVPAGSGGGILEPEIEKLSNIVKAFNDLFGSIKWTDDDRIEKIITEEIPSKVNADPAYQNAKKHSDKQNARVEHDNALQKVIVDMISDDTELFKQFMDNESFKKWLADTVFGLTYDGDAA